MINIDGFIIEEYSKNNKIIITLPQTLQTLSSTTSPIDSSRKSRLSNEELITILLLTVSCYRNQSTTSTENILRDFSEFCYVNGIQFDSMRGKEFIDEVIEEYLTKWPEQKQKLSESK